MKDTLERAKEPNIDLKSYLLSAYTHPVFKEVEEDDSVSGFGKDGGFENVLVPTKRSSRRNTPVPSKYNGSASPSLSDIGGEQQL